MTDIVERLRKRAHNGIAPMPEQSRLDMIEAAAEIERLRAALAAKRAADPGREALADQADAIDLRRLERALTVMGCAGPVSQEECAASLGDFVNRLTAAVERFGRR